MALPGGFIKGLFNSGSSKKDRGGNQNERFLSPNSRKQNFSSSFSILTNTLASKFAIIIDRRQNFT